MGQGQQEVRAEGISDIVTAQMSTWGVMMILKMFLILVQIIMDDSVMLPLIRCEEETRVGVSGGHPDKLILVQIGLRLQQ